MYVKEDGSVLSKYEQRNELLFFALEKEYKKIEKEVKENKARNKPVKLKVGGRFSIIIYSVLAQLPFLSKRDYSLLDSEMIEDCLRHYMIFLSKYALIDIPNTKQLFSAYMGITEFRYNDLLESKDVDIAMAMQRVESFLNGLLFASAESSENNMIAIMQRAKIKKSGQGMVQTADELYIPSHTRASNELLYEKVKQIVLNYGEGNNLIEGSNEELD